MDNIDIRTVEKLKNILSNEYLESIIKEIDSKEKELENKYTNPFEFEIKDNKVMLSIKKKITPETRHRLRQIVKSYPKTDLKKAIAETNLQNPDIGSEMELRKKTVELYPQYTLQDISDFVTLGNNFIDINYEYELDLFYMRYFQEILSMDANSKILKDTEIISDGKISDVWNNVDMTIVKEAIIFFRKKVGI